MKILKIENKAAKVKLDDTVDEYSRRELQKEIAKTYGSQNAGNVAAFGEITNCVENAVDTLDIEINSPGGSVFDGYIIYNELLALRARGVHVTATINALAASMGSVIAMAADTVRIVPNGMMMIHEASGGARGNAKQLSKMAEVLENISNGIAEIYSAKTGKTVEEMRALMLDETWLNAKQAVELGLANDIFDIRQPENNIPSSHADNPITDMKYLDRLTNPSAPEALERITALEATISTNDAEHAAALAERDAVITAHAATIATAETALAEASEVRAQNVTLTTDLATANATIATNAETISAHATELATAKASAKAEAIAIAAAAGITAPLNIEGDATEKPDHLKVMATLSPSERTEYYLKNEAEIRAMLSK